MDHDPAVGEIVGNVRVKRCGFPVIENSLEKSFAQLGHQCFYEFRALPVFTPGVSQKFFEIPLDELALVISDRESEVSFSLLRLSTFLRSIAHAYMST